MQREREGGGRGRDRDRHTDRQTDRQTERQRERETDRQREKERQIDRHTKRERERDRQTDRQTDRQADRQTETETETERQRQRQTDRQTDRDRETERDRDRETGRQRGTERDRDRQAGRQADRQADRRADGQRQRQIQTQTQTDRTRQTGRQKSHLSSTFHRSSPLLQHNYKQNKAEKVHQMVPIPSRASQFVASIKGYYRAAFKKLAQHGLSAPACISINYWPSRARRARASAPSYSECSCCSTTWSGARAIKGHGDERSGKKSKGSLAVSTCFCWAAYGPLQVPVAWRGCV